MYKIIDLFAGAGGLSLGFQQTEKFKIIAAAEISNDAKATFRKNIVTNIDEFEFIDNVIGCDFKKLNERFDGIDVVIGGPPCQGFSNANRQKSNLISMNNGLVKEYFRAIKEIKPKAFVMENVNMLRSDKHRFYDSGVDNIEIDDLISQGFNIPKRLDKILISDAFEDIDIFDIASTSDKVSTVLISQQLFQALNVLKKNLNNKERLDKYLSKRAKFMITQINDYLCSLAEPTPTQKLLLDKLLCIRIALESNQCDTIKTELAYIVNLQKALHSIRDIYDNKLIGKFVLTDKNELQYEVNSYSVIDYIDAILGNEYVQAGDTLNSKWFGVPQERKRYIKIGIRKDIIKNAVVSIPTEPKKYDVLTVADAISDLNDYTVGYEKEYAPIHYNDSDKLCSYAKLMRKNSDSIKNHIATKTTATAMERFKAIEQGKNFHSLSSDMKKTYSKPERTQNTIYLRLDPTKPSGTVVNVRKSMWIHPVLHRAITVREAARLQSFPDSFEFVGTKDSQYQQVGNAVPPLLAKGIADKILEYLK